MKELPQRKPIRLKGYDYSSNGAYYLTLCVKDRHEMLGKIENDTMILSEYGEIVRQELINSFYIRTECILDRYIIMPNHIHMILLVNQPVVGDDGNRPEFFT